MTQSLKMAAMVRRAVTLGDFQLSERALARVLASSGAKASDSQLVDAALRCDLRVDASTEAAAALEHLGTRSCATPCVIAQIVGDARDASRPSTRGDDGDDDGGDSDSRMLMFEVACGATRRVAFESKTLRATRKEFGPGCKLRLSRDVGTVGDFLRLTPETAKALGRGARDDEDSGARPTARTISGGPPPFEPFEYSAAKATPVVAGPVKQKPLGIAAVATVGDRKSLRLKVEALALTPAGGLVVTLADAVEAVAAPPLNAFLFKAGVDPQLVLTKLRPYFAGKTLALDLERTPEGLVLHNLS